MRIKRIEEADFRRADLGLWEMFQKANSRFVDSLKNDDVVVFISKKRNQLLFIHGFDLLDTAGSAARVLPSTRYRILGSTWEPLKLRNYAEEAGLKIEGLKLFEEHYGYLTGSKP